MSLSPALVRLADDIIARLRDGVVLDNDVRHFIESACGVHEAEDQLNLIRQAAEPDAAEGEELLELTFFPDHRMRLALESAIQEAAPGDDDLPELAQRIAPEGEGVAVRLFLGDRETTVRMDEDAAGGFLSRLNPDFEIPERTREAATDRLSEDVATDLFVRMRTARRPWNAGGASFLARLIEELGAETDLPELFSFALGLLDEAEKSGNIYSALMTRKRRLSEALRQARRLDRQLQKSTMETLMMQGVRVLYIDQEDARRQMDLIDRIAMAVFHRTESFDIIEQNMEIRSKDELMDRMAE